MPQSWWQPRCVVKPAQNDRRDVVESVSCQLFPESEVGSAVLSQGWRSMLTWRPVWCQKRNAHQRSSPTFAYELRELNTTSPTQAQPRQGLQVCLVASQRPIFLCFVNGIPLGVATSVVVVTSSFDGGRRRPHASQCDNRTRAMRHVQTTNVVAFVNRDDDDTTAGSKYKSGTTDASGATKIPRVVAGLKQSTRAMEVPSVEAEQARLRDESMNQARGQVKEMLLYSAFVLLFTFQTLFAQNDQGTLAVCDMHAR